MKYSLRWIDHEGRVCWVHTDDILCANSAARALSRAYTECTVHSGAAAEMKYRHGEVASVKA